MGTSRKKSKKINQPRNGGLMTRDHAPVPLLGVKISGRLQGRAVELAVAQRYRNLEEHPIECTYVFPLPSDAAVCGLEVRTGDRTLRGVVEEREHAFELYDKAMAKGDGAVLLDQERENVFQLSVGNLLPGQEAVIETRMVYRADCSDGKIRLLIPTTVAPRYSPPTLGADQRREVERTTPDYSLAVPYGMSIDIVIESGAVIRSVESPSHPVKFTVDGTTARVTLSHGEEAPERDFVLIVETAASGEPTLIASRRGDRDHLLLELVPKLPMPADEGPREVLFLVDCSGSMQGDSIDQARRAVELCLRALLPRDRFLVGRFGNTFELLSEKPLACSKRNLEATLKKVQAMQADLGGTDLLPALQEIAKGITGRADLILITDGQVSDEDAVFRFVNNSRDMLRIFAFGVGASSSESLVKGLARETGGAAEFVSLGERIEEKVLRQFARIVAPMLEEMKIDWAGLEVEQAPLSSPPLFPGDTIAITARLGEGVVLEAGAIVTVTGKTAHGPVVWQARPVRPADGEAVPLLWARERIRDLEAGHGLPAGSRQERGDDKTRKALVAIAREYGLLCSETSLVAIEERTADQRTTEQPELRRVPVMVPKGWHGGVESDVADVDFMVVRSCEEPEFPPPFRHLFERVNASPGLLETDGALELLEKAGIAGDLADIFDHASHLGIDVRSFATFVLANLLAGLKGGYLTSDARRAASILGRHAQRTEDMLVEAGRHARALLGILGDSTARGMLRFGRSPDEFKALEMIAQYPTLLEHARDAVKRMLDMERLYLRQAKGPMIDFV